MRFARLLAGSIVFSLLATGCDWPVRVIAGSGEEGSESRDVPAFTAVLIQDSLEATITLAPDQPQSVEIRGDDNVVPMVRTQVETGKLVVSLPPSIGFYPKLPLVVTISATELHRLEGEDSAKVKADRVEGNDVFVTSSDSSEVTVDAVSAGRDVSISVSDSSFVEAGTVTAGAALSISASDSATVDLPALTVKDEVTVTAEDSSDVFVQGDAETLDAHLSDSSRLDADELTVAAVEIEAADSSEAAVCATESLLATLSDSSAVTYTCDPKDVTKKLDDSSTLTEQ